MGNPFRPNKPTPSPDTGEKAAAPPPGKHIVQSQRSGDPLPAASADVPAHSPLIPWPPAEPPAHKPMKLKP